MHKRIALLIIGVVLAGGAFLLYQFISGASFLAGHKAPVQTVVATRSAPLTFEYRTATGELRYVLTSKSMEQIKDAGGKAIPGQFKMYEPVATFFTHDGRAISIRGDTCQIAVDQTHGGGGKDVPQIRDGKLSGNIVLTIGGKPAAPGSTAEDTGKDDTVVRFESDVLLNGADQLLTSPGKVQVRSNVIVFDGAGFTLNYSIDKARLQNQRVEFLRIEKGNKIILKNRGAKAFSLDSLGNKSTTTKTASTEPVVATTGPATAPVDPAELPTAYKLSFGKDVTATHSTTVMKSEELFVLFTAPANKTVVKAANAPVEEEPVKSGKPAVAGTQRVATTAKATTLPLIEPMGEAGPDDLVIRWVGPMEMRPVEQTDVQLVDANDVALEAVGTLEKPVRVVELGPASGKKVAGANDVLIPKQWVSAGKLWYHKAEQRLELAPGDAGKVELFVMGSPVNGAKTGVEEPTTLVCQGVSVLLDEKGQNARHVTLTGPGVLKMPASAIARKEASSTPIVAEWSRMLDVDLETRIDPVSKKSSPVARHVVMGGAAIRDADFDLVADQLDIALANSGSGSSAVMEHLLATGNVSVKSFKKGTAGIDAQRLEVETAMFEGQKTLQPSRVIADGEVKAFQMTDKKDKAGVVASTKQSVYGPHLEADLEPGAKVAAGVAPGAVSTTLPAEVVTADFGTVGGGKVKRFLVNGGIRVTLESTKEETVEVAAESLDAVLPLATLRGKDKDNPVHIIRGANEDEVFADLVELNQDDKTFVIPAAGRVQLAVKDKKTKKSTPMVVTWTKDMRFDGKAMEAKFTGDVVAETSGETKSPGFLKCNQVLTVKMLDSAGRATSTGDFNSTGAGGIDWILAEGKVDTRAMQQDEIGNVLTDMDLNTEKLLYLVQKKTLKVPMHGVMTLTDHRPEKVKVAKVGDDPTSGQSMRGDSLFVWDGSFTFDQDKNLILFEKNVKMRFMPAKPFHVAEEKDANGQVKPPMPVLLQTNNLTATLVKPKGKVGQNSVSPAGLGADGNFDLGEVTAGGSQGNGSATITMDDFILTGYKIGFDKEKLIIRAIGNDSMKAMVRRSGRGMVEATSILWDLTAGQNRFEFVEPTGTFEAMQDIQN